jgi:hypothetical protein
MIESFPEKRTGISSGNFLFLHLLKLMTTVDHGDYCGRRVARERRKENCIKK